MADIIVTFVAKKKKKGENQGFVNWKQRFDIILGTATVRELSYLHEDYHGRIIHRDIKPSNLLDDDLHQR